jgi:hypothetical protein
MILILNLFIKFKELKNNLDINFNNLEYDIELRLDSLMEELQVMRESNNDYIISTDEYIYELVKVFSKH